MIRNGVETLQQALLRIDDEVFAVVRVERFQRGEDGIGGAFDIQPFRPGGYLGQVSLPLRRFCMVASGIRTCSSGLLPKPDRSLCLRTPITVSGVRFPPNCAVRFYQEGLLCRKAPS
jgi:hypothetical protein